MTASDTEQPRILPSITLMGVRIHAVTENDVNTHILRELDAGRGGWVATPNLDHMRRLSQGGEFRAVCQEASLLVPDGIPLLWASRLQRNPLPGRVAGSDLIQSLSAAAARESRSLFLLGGDPGTAENAADELRKRYPGTGIAGTLCPEFGFEDNESAMKEIVETLQRTQPDIVFVALGSPKQELLMQRLSEVLPKSWWLGVGISFSFLTGDVKRAPVWAQKVGLEWFHRLSQEPGRLARRYLLQGVPFAIKMLTGSAWIGIRGPRVQRRADHLATSPGNERPAMQAVAHGDLRRDKTGS